MLPGRGHYVACRPALQSLAHTLTHSPISVFIPMMGSVENCPRIGITSAVDILNYPTNLNTRFRHSRPWLITVASPRIRYTTGPFFGFQARSALCNGPLSGR